MAKMLDTEPRIDRIDAASPPANVSLAGPRSPEAPKFVRSVLDRASDIHDDLAIALLVRARDERESDRVALEPFLELLGIDVAELERELDAEHE